MPAFLQTAFLAGLAALAVPILIHLFFRLRTKRVELGTIRFLKIVLEENARRRKVMRWFLLALRLAFVGLLVALFARPYLTPASAGGAKELLVVLIDQSATMQFKGEQGRLLDQAVSKAQALIAEAGKNSRVEIAFFDHAVYPRTAPLGASQPTTGELLPASAANLSLYGATNYGLAIEWARDVLVSAPPGPKQLHLFTDLQQSGLDWTEVQPLPDDVRAHLHDLGRSVVNNVAVTELRTPRFWIRPGESTTLRATVQHGGPFGLNEVPVVLEIGRNPQHAPTDAGTGAKAAGQLADFAKLSDRITRRERVKLEPGATQWIEFELPSLAEGLWLGRVAVECDDDLAFDNQRFVAISATPGYRVLIVRADSGAVALLPESYFLEASLRLARLGETYAESPFGADVVDYAEGIPLPALGEYGAVILVNPADISPADAAAIASFVRQGGGLLVFSGDNVSAQSSAALQTAELGVGDIQALQVTQDLPWRFNAWDESHPVFEALSDPQHGDLRRWIFAAYTRVVPADDAHVLASFSTGDPAVLEKKLGAGRVLWVTTSCGPEWSDWSRSRLFLPMMHQLLGYQVGLADGGRVRPRLVDADRIAGLGEPRGEPAETTPSLPGVLQFKRHVEVLNTSPRESETEICSREDFENRFALKFVQDGNSPDDGRPAAANVEFHPDELWHWIACALVGVVLLEAFVGNRTTA